MNKFKDRNRMPCRRTARLRNSTETVCFNTCPIIPCIEFKVLKKPSGNGLHEKGIVVNKTDSDSLLSSI